MMNALDGALLVKEARSSMGRFYRNNLEKRKTDKKKLNEKHGLFVTIKDFPSNRLRGCIGFISPMPLYEAVQKAAIEAAFHDPRFPPLEKTELDSVTIELSIMTEPKPVPNKSLKEIKSEVKIGSDGLLVSNANYSGLLLPQVPVEQDWGVEEFLEGLCQKACMPYEFLTDENTSLWKFQCQIFSELEPNGKVEEIEFNR